MPLHGKIVVIKRSGGDGTDFPLMASCLFGRKPDCDIRIQLPQVSKEHCRIDLNENKEVMLTNLSSVNPTCINGVVMNQAKRLKHGDIITIIDRSFRFEYPPEPTPKKRRPSASGKSETLQVLHDQQVRDPGVLVTGERRKSSELTSDSSCLKDGTNTSNVQACTVQDCGDAAKEAIASVLEQSKPSDKESLSPFCELYQMIKQNMQPSRNPSEAAQPKTPLFRCEAPKTMDTKIRAGGMDGEEPTSQDADHTPLPKNMTEQKRKSSVGCEENKQAEGGFGGKATPKSAKRSSKLHTPKTPTDENSESSLTVSGVSTLPTEGQVEDSSQPVATPSKGTPNKSRRSLQSPAKQSEKPSVLEEMRTPTSQKKPRQATPKRFSAGEVVRQIVSEHVAEETCRSAEKSEIPKGRRSKESRSMVLPCPISDSVTPGGPSGSQSPDIPDVLNLKQAHIEEEAEISKEIPAERSPKTKEAASPQRVSPRKSPRKNLKAPDVLLEIEFAAPPSGGKAVIAGNPPPSGKKRKSGKLENDLPTPRLKRKRVSFGTQLSPELFDRRLPPNSPLRKGATPGRRGLSFLKRAVLTGVSTIDLMEEMGAEMLSPKSKSQRSPGKKASPKSVPSVNGSPSSAKKSPKKVKTPSPKKAKASGSPGPKTPSPARPQSPCTKEPMTPKGKKSLTPCAKTPSPAPSTGRTPAKAESSGTPRGKKTPSASAKTPSPGISARRGRKSVSDALKTPSPVQPTAEASVTPLPVQMASRSAAKTPSLRGTSFDDGSSNKTPTVSGRFSVSRISTPSPVADQDTGAAGLSERVTPCAPLRRKSMKSTSKKTPKSARKSVLEVIRSRRSGASRANFKVVSSWADIVKFGVSKPQACVPTQNRTAKAATVKKAVVKKPKTPAKKVQEHFSTGHAASPATIVVGKAHIKVSRAAGSAPKLVHNIALLRKDMKVNEDLTGLAEMFCTPVNVREKKILTSSSSCPETPQAATSPFTEDSVICTPEEIGEMVVSPLSVASTAKRGTYNSEAVTRLLQEDQDSSLIGVDASQGSVDALTASVVPAQCAEKQDPVLKRIRTPKQKPEPPMCLTGVKRLMKTPKQKAQQVVDLRGIKRLLKTPKEPKVSREVSLVGVKEMLKTPKPPKGQPVEDLVGVQKMMKTPVLKKAEPSGVKRLKKTPKEKGQPVEDMFGLRRLMQTPKQKLEPVEDLTGVKQLMQTPKQKGKPVENKFGIRRLMKSPKERGCAAVEDFAGLRELMEEPSDYLLSEVGINKRHETSEEKISETSVSQEVGKNLSAPAETDTASREEPAELKREENQSNASKKRGRPQKQVENPLVAETKDGDSESVVVINADDADQNLPDVKSKRGRKARPVAETPVKRTRQKITEIKEEPVSSAIAPPTKPTRGKRARNVEEFEKVTVKDEPCENVESSKQRDDGVDNADVEVVSIAEPAALVQAPAKGRRGKRTEDTPRKVPAPAPVKKIGRGRKAKATESTASDESVMVECIEMPPTPQKTEDAPEKISSPVPVVKPRRGQKQIQLDDGHVTAAQAAESDVFEAAQSDIGRCPEKISSPVPVVKPRRGQKQIQLDDGHVTAAQAAESDISEAAQSDIGRCPEKISSPVPVVKPRRGRKQIQLDDGHVTAAQAAESDVFEAAQSDIGRCPEKISSPVPVVKPRRGQKQIQLDDGHVTAAQAAESDISEAAQSDIGRCPEKISSPVPVVKPRRGRKQIQLDDGHLTAAQAAESDVSEAVQSDTGSRVPETEEQAPVRSGRGRKTKAVAQEDQLSLEVPAKRTRRGAIDLTVQTAAPSPVPVIKSGRGRGRKAQNLDSREEVVPIQAEALSTECSTEPPRKTRGKGKPAKTSESVTDNVAPPAPVHSEGGDCMPVNSLPNDLVKNVRGRTSRTGKIVSQKAGVDEADKKDLKTSDVKAVKKTLSKKAVSWSSHLGMPHTSESEELASSVRGSPQRKLKKSEEPTAGLAESAGNSGVETEANLKEQTKSRRGRAGKKATIQPTESSLVTEHHDPEPCTGKAPSTRKGRTPKSEPAKQDAPVAKRVMKRKPTPENVDEVTGDNEPASESVEPDSQPKRARSRAAKAEETKGEASTSSKMKRGVAKKTGQALENEVEKTEPKPAEPKQVETPKPAGRGRRKPVQQAEIKPEPMRGSPTKAKMETAKTDAKTTTRGRVKTQKKADSTSSTEPKPVRSTRRK